MRTTTICLLMIANILVGTTHAAFTADDLVTAQAALRQVMIDDDDLIPEFVRMIFHDCVGPEGCNGCLDVHTHANGGLTEAIELSQTLRAQHAPELSQADFNVLLGTEATKLGIDKSRRGGERNGKTSIPFFVGRRDCAVVTPDSELPHGQILSTVQFFADQFDMNPKEATAIMGGHSLGHLHRGHSGFTGHWDNTESTLDNKYYENMLRRNYIMQQVNTSKTTNSTQWSDGDLTMLLSDAILLKEYTTSGDADTPSCAYRECGEQDVTARIVKDYARNQQKFQRDFISAFLKMVSKAPGATLTELKPGRPNRGSKRNPRPKKNKKPQKSKKFKKPKKAKKAKKSNRGQGRRNRMH